MLPYPFCLYNVKIYPVLGEGFDKSPCYISLGYGSKHKELQELPTPEFQKSMEAILLQEKTNWAVSGYMENRATLLRDCPQMVNEQRFYHLGLDISAPLGSKLYAPLNCEVVRAEYEEGNGNYGGFVVLKCCENGTTFYLLFGHLNPNKLPHINTRIKQGQVFAELGDFSQNGNWFYHTHLQVLTEQGFNDGWINKGYCKAEDIPQMETLCPSPYYLLRVN